METANCEFVDFPACIVADCLAKESLNKSEELIIAILITSILLVYMCAFILDAKIKGKIFKYYKYWEETHMFIITKSEIAKANRARLFSNVVPS
jgi:hypothetical protein